MIILYNVYIQKYLIVLSFYKEYESMIQRFFTTENFAFQRRKRGRETDGEEGRRCHPTQKTEVSAKYGFGL
jgi:hypothetical protein